MKKAMPAKYIVVMKGGLEKPYVFSESDVHADIAQLIGGKVISAGFCYVNEQGQYTCYGKSTSLGVDARKADSKLLTAALS
jgi:hypothetical protein